MASGGDRGAAALVDHEAPVPDLLDRPGRRRRQPRLDPRLLRRDVRAGRAGARRDDGRLLRQLSRRRPRRLAAPLLQGRLRPAAAASSSAGTPATSSTTASRSSCPTRRRSHPCRRTQRRSSPRRRPCRDSSRRAVALSRCRALASEGSSRKRPYSRRKLDDPPRASCRCERRVAQQAADGLLAYAFDKLGVRSRTQLRDALGGQAPPPATRRARSPGGAPARRRRPRARSRAGSARRSPRGSPR